MTPVAAIQGSNVRNAARGPRDTPEAAHDAETASGRALIPLQPATRSDPQLRTRPQAGFLAHLIATDSKLPQTRERRRAEPAEAIAAYAAAGRATRSRGGRRLFRST